MTSHPPPNNAQVELAKAQQAAQEMAEADRQAREIADRAIREMHAADAAKAARIAGTHQPK